MFDICTIGKIGYTLGIFNTLGISIFWHLIIRRCPVMIYCSVIVINLIVQLGEEFDEKTADMREVRTRGVFEAGKLVLVEKVSPSPSLSSSSSSSFSSSASYQSLDKGV